jgi:osmotically-inducible protein OsmY
MRNRLNAFLLSALAATFIAAGCTQEARQEYDKAGDQAGQAAQSTGDAIQKDAEVAGEAVEDAAEKSAIAAAAGEMTVKVKSALLAADDLEVRDLNVDTIEKTVYLKGEVASAEAKSRAETLAKGIAGNDYKVVNELKIDSTLKDDGN